MERKKINQIAKKITSSAIAPFIGKGKLTEYKKKSDGWILNQMDTKKVDSGIKIDKDKDEQIHFKTNE